ncbi:MAG: PH domain-containing protein [Bacteroidota bacterium]
MFEFKRQHPVAALARAWDLIKNNLINIGILVFIAGGSTPSKWHLLTTLGILILVLVIGFLRWQRFLFKVENGTLYVESGIISRQSLSLSSDRIQVIDINAGPIQRMFGLVSVQIRTAGSASANSTIDALTHQEAEDLKKALQKHRVAPSEPDETEETAPAEPVYQRRISRADLWKAALSSGSFGVVLSMLATIFSQADQLLTEERLERWLSALRMSDLPGATVTLLFAVGIFLLAYILAVAGFLIVNGGFKVTVWPDELVIQRGLFEQKQSTIPFNRIQAVRIVEGLFRQPFGWASLHIDSAGFGEGQSHSSVLYPLIRKEQLESVMEELMPDYAQHISLQSLPQRSLRRYLFRTLTPAVVLIGAISWWDMYWLQLAWLLVPLAIWAWWRYNDAGIGLNVKDEHSQKIALRYRLLSRTTALVPVHRVQSLTLRQTVFQKRAELTTVQLAIASRNSGHTFRVSDLETVAGEDIWQLVDSNSSSSV